MYVISPTDPNWFNFLKENYVTGLVNFWTPTPWKASDVKIGSKWYFKKKGGDKLICGYGIFQGISTMTVKEAWKVYGPNNGCESYAAFREKLGSYNADISDDKQIGAISLSNVVFFDESDYINLDALGVVWSNSIVKFKRYFDNDKIYSSASNWGETPFTLVSKVAKRKKTTETTCREGQSEFRQAVSAAYNYRCCITNDSCSDLLEAAHIQSYISRDSNHVQNGLLLRVDFHKMFDSGLMAIDSNYCVKVSSLVMSEYYQSFNGKRISLPNNVDQYPSKEALKLKISELR